MPNFTNHILTTGGQALIAQAHLGRKLTFTKIAVGSGNVATPINATALATHQMDVGITSIQRDATNPNQVRVRGVFNNVALTTGFQFREMGLFARIDSEPEVLYSYVADSGAGDLIPAYDGANPVIVYPTIIVIIESTIPIHADITIGADFECENIGLPTVGPGWYARREGNTFQFKRAVEGVGIDLIETSDTVTIAQKVLHLDLDLYVPINHPDKPADGLGFATIQAAWDHLEQFVIPPQRTARIFVANGQYNLTGVLNLRHPQGERISIIAPNVFQRTPTGNVSAYNDGTNWHAIFSLGSAANINVGDWIGLSDIATGAWCYTGIWRIVNVVGNDIDVIFNLRSDSNFTPSFLGGAAQPISGTARIFKCIINAAAGSAAAVRTNSLGLFQNFMINGNLASALGFTTSEGRSEIRYCGISGFTHSGIYGGGNGNISIADSYCSFCDQGFFALTTSTVGTGDLLFNPTRTKISHCRNGIRIDRSVFSYGNVTSIICCLQGVVIGASFGDLVATGVVGCRDALFATTGAHAYIQNHGFALNVFDAVAESGSGLYFNSVIGVSNIPKNTVHLPSGSIIVHAGGP